MSKQTERMVKGYLRPANYAFVKGYAEVNEISASKVINEAVANLKKCLPPEHLQKIVDRNKY